MSIDSNTVFTKVTVLPKNSVIRENSFDNLFYNIETGKVAYGSGYKEKCSWFEHIESDYYLVKDDTMYIKFIDDIAHPKKGYCSACELIHEDLDYGEIRCDYPAVWEIVAPDFKDFLDERKYSKLTLPYLMNINIHSTYCSYAGDGDVYLNIIGVIKVSGSSFKETKIAHKFDKYYI